MGEVLNCKICGKVFQSNGYTNVCQECMTHDEQDFERIREYLELHPRASIYEVATNLDITISRIKHHLREGRIEIVESENQFLKCEFCGKPIHSGRYCDSCIRSPRENRSQTTERSIGDYSGYSQTNSDNNPNSTNHNKAQTTFNYRSKDKK